MDARESVRVSEDGPLAVPSVVLAGAIQELGRPLERIADHAQLCQRWADSMPAAEELGRSLEEIAILVARGRRQIRNIAHAWRLERPDAGTVDVNGVVNEAALQLESELSRAGVSLKLEPAIEIPSLRGDKSHLRHALGNLIENAVESMDGTEARRREIVVATRVTPEGITIEVSDCGCGIAAAVADRVFEPFFTTKNRGMGLGLTAARLIARQHGGALIASRRPDGGTTMRLSLPIVSAEARRPTQSSGQDLI